MEGEHPSNNVLETETDAVRLQLVWSVVFSHGSAYLFHLGITESQSSLVWAIAPICGALVQPIVGVVADNFQSRWGRRRPFILAGMVGVALSLTALAFMGNISRYLEALSAPHFDTSFTKSNRIGAITCITFFSLSVQLLQSGLRALIVDVCPLEQQTLASAWAGRLAAIGSIFGYILGSLPLDAGSLESETRRFRFLSFVSVAVLVCTVGITSWWIHEEDSRGMTHRSPDESLFFHVSRNLMHTWSSMTSQARHTCFVQFFAWMGWFGFLFYSTSYVGRLFLTESRRHGVEHFDRLEDAGIRLGTFASLLAAIMALATTTAIPYITSMHMIPSQYGESMLEKSQRRIRSQWWQQTHNVWAMSLLLYVLCNFSTFFISSTYAAISVVTLTGVSWGITQWAPFALLGEEIAVQRANEEWTTSNSGAIMGIHNTAISIPQIIAALGSSVIFRLSEGHGSIEGHGIALVLRASGAAALVAAYLAMHLR